MVRSDGIDLFNLVAESHRLVNQKLDEVVRGGFSGQQFEFFVDPIAPSATDASTDLRGVGKMVSGKLRARRLMKYTYNYGAHRIQDFTGLHQRVGSFY